MALNEACQLWIEQRLEEELKSKNKTGDSLREIGRRISAEVEQFFETKIEPQTITMRASRQSRGVTPVTGVENEKKSNGKGKLEKLEKPKHGGARAGAGRKSLSKRKDRSTGYDFYNYKKDDDVIGIITELEKLEKDNPKSMKFLEVITQQLFFVQSSAELILQWISENRSRFIGNAETPSSGLPLTLLDKRNAAKKMISNGLSMSEIAQALKIKKANVKVLLSIAGQQPKEKERLSVKRQPQKLNR